MDSHQQARAAQATLEIDSTQLLEQADREHQARPEEAALQNGAKQLQDLPNELLFHIAFVVGLPQPVRPPCTFVAGGTVHVHHTGSPRSVEYDATSYRVTQDLIQLIPSDQKLSIAKKHWAFLAEKWAAEDLHNLRQVNNQFACIGAETALKLARMGSYPRTHSFSQLTFSPFYSALAHFEASSKNEFLRPAITQLRIRLLALDLTELPEDSFAVVLDLCRRKLVAAEHHVPNDSFVLSHVLSLEPERTGPFNHT